LVTIVSPSIIIFTEKRLCETPNYADPCKELRDMCKEFKDPCKEERDPWKDPPFDFYEFFSSSNEKGPADPPHLKKKKIHKNQMGDPFSRVQFFEKKLTNFSRCLVSTHVSGLWQYLSKCRYLNIKFVFQEVERLKHFVTIQSLMLSASVYLSIFISRRSETPPRFIVDS
jgi:hypothetical protein